MGLSLRDKAASAVEQQVHEAAHAAYLEGRPVYCPTLGVASGIAGGLGVDPWTVAIDAIEAAGVAPRALGHRPPRQRAAGVPASR